MRRSAHEDRMALWTSIVAMTFVMALIGGMAIVIAAGSGSNEEELAHEQECSMASPSAPGLSDNRSDRQKDFYRSHCE
ncbi:MAG: hypothetical protein JWL80_294 [Parcubacteria group bacterium]|nr:hypothetical protein [Parcubacteria group bacterium]